MILWSRSIIRSKIKSAQKLLRIISRVSRIPSQRDSLTAQTATINQDQSGLSSLVDSINGLANTLNRMAASLNLTVSTYNSIGSSRGQEYEEGVFVSEGGQQEIDIYEFENQDNLIRVLAHELGHSLGMEHVSDPNAIMYYLNQGKNIQPTTDDLTELKKVCKIAS